MAFDPQKLNALVTPLGNGAIRFFSYETDESEDNVIATDFMPKAADYGVKLYDIIIVSPASGAKEPYFLTVDAIDADGNATLVIPSNAIDVSNAASSAIIDDNGDEIPSGTSGRWRITSGTFAAPVTTKGPLLRIDKYENISSAEQANPADNGHNAALAIFTQGSAGSEVQTAGIWSYARGAGTTVGKTADVCAFLGIGEAIRDSTRVAFGGYFEGKKNFAANRGAGAEIRASNYSGADDAYTPGALTSAGLWITAGGDGDPGAGIALGRVSAGINFKVGVGVYAAIDAAFRDDSSAATSLLINGSHERGIDLSGGTFSGSAILLPNAGKLRSMNADASATIELIHLTSGNQLVLGPAATNTIRMNTGGTAALGFFGAATVAKPTVSGSRANPEAALADLLAELATLGLITNSTTA